MKGSEELLEQSTSLAHQISTNSTSKVASAISSLLEFALRNGRGKHLHVVEFKSLLYNHKGGKHLGAVGWCKVLNLNLISNYTQILCYTLIVDKFHAISSRLYN
jgi:hypothetical protein